MKKFLVTLLFVLIAIPSYSQQGISSFGTFNSQYNPNGSSTPYILLNMGMMPLYEIGGKTYDISTNGLGDNGIFFGATIGYLVAQSMGVELSYSYNNYFMTSTISLGGQTPNSSYRVYSHDIKLYGIIQPTIPSRMGFSVAPYLGVGTVYSRLFMDINLQGLPGLKGDFESFGGVAKAGVRFIMSNLMTDIGLEYEHKPYNGGVTENTVKGYIGIGMMF